MEIQWSLILFSSFMAWSCGLFASQAIALIRGAAKTVQFKALIVSFILMVIGGISVFFHLHHWERIFNGFGHITSGITQELIGVVLVVVAMVIYYIFLRRSEGGEMPKWVLILAVVICVIMVIIMGMSYLMPSRPAWNSFFEVASLIGAACILGPATLTVLVNLPTKQDKQGKKTNDVAIGSDASDSVSTPEPTTIASIADETEASNAMEASLEKQDFIGSIVNGVCVIAYIIAMVAAGSAFTQIGEYFVPSEPMRNITISYSGPFGGDSLVLTILVVIAAIVSIVAVVEGKKTKKWFLWGLVALLAAIVCTVVLRVIFYQLGVSVYPFY